MRNIMEYSHVAVRLRSSANNSKIKNYCLFLLVIIAILSTSINSTAANPGDSKWLGFGGYGFTHTNLGQTEVWVQTVFLTAGYERVLTNEHGSSWFKGYHSARVEVPFHYVISPDSGIMTGINFIALWHFTNLLNDYQPYILAGGGPVYIDADIPGMSKDLNGTYMFGAGGEFDLGFSKKITLEYRFNHISNGGQKEPNVPLNSSRLMVGFSF